MVSDNFNYKIAIVLVFYNSKKYLRDCLDSLRKQNYGREFVRIIGVDNASGDGTAEYIKNNYPEVFLIQNSKNEGFARGNNIGITEAMKDNPDFVVLLNQDTVVEKDWLKELVKKASESPGIGAVQSLLLLWDDKDVIQTSGNHIHYLGFGYSGNYKLPLSEFRGGDDDIAYASGAAVLLKADVLKEVGLLDEDLFLYHEDLDWGWRMRVAGYQIKRVDSSIVYHKYSFGRNKAKNYFMERNRLMVLLKNYKLATIFLIFPALLLMEIGMISYSFFGGWGKEKLKSYRDAAAALPTVWKKRKTIQKSRKVKDKDIVKFFSGKVEFAELPNPILKYVANPILDLYGRLVKRIIWW